MSAEKEPLFSKKNIELITGPLGKNNPITVQCLGICSALAVTVKLEPAIILSISVVAVLSLSNVIISLLRKTIPDRIRIIVQLVVIASLVIIVDEILKAFSYEVSKALSVFVGLIITNCIIMGRLEAFALGNKPWRSLLDGVGNGLGYGVILILVAFIREVLGSGTITLPMLGEIRIIPDVIYSWGYENNGLMLLSPMALLVVGLIIWVQRSRNKELIEEN
ncbi:MAG: NADH:ubiquinone reductase (Na(+)-transporting) subunit D [Bacteroidales bacterium]|jgi:Na+-transporting NADH:ubiquinone oxidoreductase subunit D|nr:NADH:ubiquinone reductase (Na(+)-transporting) subunit D [Bacteroidales bacterium]